MHRLSPADERRRFDVYATAFNDAHAARLVGISFSSWSEWCASRGLQAKEVHCGCGRKIVREPWRLKLLLCSRCRQAAAARTARKWNDSAFRDRVRALIGQMVTVRYSVSGPGALGGGFRHVRGVLKGIKGGGLEKGGYLLLRRTGHGFAHVPKTAVVGVWGYFFDRDWPCGCGCGSTIRLKYRPAHGPPFFLSGHASRIQTANRGRWKPGQHSWNRGVRGRAWWRRIPREKRASVLAGLEVGHRLLKEKATYTTHSKDGYVLVRVDGFNPCGAPKMRLRGRLVMERALARELRPDEIVVHLNGVRSDDRPENLALLLARDKPALRHGLGRGLRGEELRKYVLEARGVTQRPFYWRDRRKLWPPARRAMAPRRSPPDASPAEPLARLPPAALVATAGGPPFCASCRALRSAHPAGHCAQSIAPASAAPPGVPLPSTTATHT